MQDLGFRVGGAPIMETKLKSKRKSNENSSYLRVCRDQGFYELEYLFGGPYKKDGNIWKSILGSPNLWRLSYLNQGGNRENLGSRIMLSINTPPPKSKKQLCYTRGVWCFNVRGRGLISFCASCKTLLAQASV